MQLFSPVQCLGYAAYIVGVMAFLQKSDRRFKLFSANQCLVYALHFVLLSNIPAGTSALISSARSFLAVRTRSPLLAGSFILLNVAAGTAFARSGAAWLPVIASCIATLAIFYMRAIPMRLVLLGCTLMWLANNILSRSVGGTLLELTIAIINGINMIRMLKADTVGAWYCESTQSNGGVRFAKFEAE